MSAEVFVQKPQWGQSDFESGHDAFQTHSMILHQKDVAKIAEKELRETKHSKQECLNQFKIWIKQNEDIQNCILDDVFLLRFLRVKKFSIAMAQQTLLKYLNYKKKFKIIFHNMDFKEQNVFELISSGYIYASPLRDNEGRRVIIYNLSKFDLRKYSGVDLARVHAITYETLLTEEENQILGITHVADIKGMSASFATLFPVKEFGCLIKWGEQSFPMRHKAIHVLNMPKTVRYVYDLAKSNLSEKLKQRFMVHDSMSSLFGKVNKRCFPKEMDGGEIPRNEMIQSWTKELQKNREKVLLMDNIKLLNDRGIICSKNSANNNNNNNNNNLMGSFRKLEID